MSIRETNIERIRRRAFLRSVVAPIALAIVLVVGGGLVFTMAAKSEVEKNAELVLNYAIEESCLHLAHVEKTPVSMPPALSLEAQVTESLRAVHAGGLKYVQIRQGENAAFQLALDETEAARRNWTSSFQAAITKVAQRRTVLASLTTSGGAAGESCKDALARFEKRPAAGTMTGPPLPPPPGPGERRD